MYSMKCQSVQLHSHLLKRIAVGVAVGSLTFRLTYFLWRKWRTSLHYQALIACKREEREQRLQTVQQLVEAHQFPEAGCELSPDTIVRMSITQLRQHMSEGRISKLDVLRAFQHAALNAHSHTNCLTEIFYDSEIEWPSEDEDETRRAISTETEEQPLKNIPISLKNIYQLRNREHTNACPQLFGQVSAHDCVLVRVLRARGAVFFTFTNMPHAELSALTDNVTFGTTKNPQCALETSPSAQQQHAHSKSPGGSSGGESALIRLCGSVLGFGADIGGSVRIPASFSGVCALRTTSSRVSQAGNPYPFQRPPYIRNSFGPMALRVDELVVAMRAVCCPLMYELDPSIPPLPFDEAEYAGQNRGRPLRIGYYLQHGNPDVARPVSSVQRALNSVIACLQVADSTAGGHTLVPFDLQSVSRAAGSNNNIELYLNVLLADGGRAYMEQVVGDVPCTRDLQISGWRKWVRGALGLPLTMPHTGFRDVTALHAYMHERVEPWKRAFAEEFAALQLDAIVCPVHPIPAYDREDAYELLGEAIAYTSLYNLLDWPAGVLPVTQVTQDDVTQFNAALDKQTAEGGEQISPTKQKILKKLMETGVGLPIAIQIVGAPFREEIVLRLMKEVESAIAENNK